MRHTAWEKRSRPRSIHSPLEWHTIRTMTASGEANMETRDAMLTLPTNSWRSGWSKKAMLACAMSANAKTTSSRSPATLSCGGPEEMNFSGVSRSDRHGKRAGKATRFHGKHMNLLTRVVLLSA